MIVNNIQELMRQRKMTQSQLAKVLSISKRTLGDRLSTPNSFRIGEANAMAIAMKVELSQICLLCFKHAIELP